MTVEPASTLELSVVAPVYNDVECLDELHRRLTESVSKVASNYEIILVEDGGTDGSWERICALAAEDSHVRGLRLSRNFGQHFAITAGLDASVGRRVVVMDSDLQEEPEVIPRLWRKMDEGYDTVFTRRKKRRDSWFKRTTSAIFFKILNQLTDQKADPDGGTMSMLDRRVANAFLQVADAHRHYIYILRYVGFRQATVEVEHQHRFAGKSGYDLRRMLVLALDGIVSQSTRLLHLSSGLGLFFMVASFIQTARIIYERLVLHRWVEGWASVMVSIWFVGGLVLSSLGVIGLYLGKMFEQTKRRPLFIVAEHTDARGRATKTPTIRPRKTG